MKMEHNSQWVGRTAVVTGASAGIGAAICVRLARAGMRVVGLARRPELVDKLNSELDGAGCGSITSQACDVSQTDQVASTFQWIDDNCGGVDVLVNNAGIFHKGNLTNLDNRKISDEELSATIDINLKGTIMCSRHALESMLRRGVHGHIINITSIAGQFVPFSDSFNIYPSTKFGTTAFTVSLLNELATFKNNIKVSNVLPGLVATDMAGSWVNDNPALQPSDVADAVSYLLSTPPNVNIAELNITAVSAKRF